MSLLPVHVGRNVFCVLGSLRSNTYMHRYSTASAKNESKNESTIDSRDVEHHTKMRDQWWNPNGPMKALHDFNLLRVPFIRDGLVHLPLDQRSSTPLMGKKILDVGCGGGILSMPLAKLGAEVTGVDASKELVAMARQHSEDHPPLPGPRPAYLCSSVEEHAKDCTNVYDGVVASEIIEHIDNDKKELFVKSCIQTLKPGGKMFFTTPSRTRLSQFTAICMAEYVLNIIPRGTHQYEKFITPNDLTLLLERNGCHVEAVFGIFYHPLQNKWQWVNSTTFFFALEAVKLEEEAAPAR